MLDRCRAGANAVDVLFLADHHLGPGVVEQVGNFLGGQGVVDRERSGADMLRTDIQRVELDPVRHHQGDSAAPPDPEPGQSGCDLPDLRSVLPPGQRLCVTRSPKRDGIGIDRGGALERLAQGGWTLRHDNLLAVVWHAAPVR